MMMEMAISISHYRNCDANLVIREFLLSATDRTLQLSPEKVNEKMRDRIAQHWKRMSVIHSKNTGNKNV